MIHPGWNNRQHFSTPEGSIIDPPGHWNQSFFALHTKTFVFISVIFVVGNVAFYTYLVPGTGIKMATKMCHVFFLMVQQQKIINCNLIGQIA